MCIFNNRVIVMV